MNTWNAGQILSVVRTINKMDISYLGPDDVTQNQTLFQFMNLSLWALPRLAYMTDASDVMSITTDGPVAFTKGGSAITNVYEPLRFLKIVDSREDEFIKRYSDSGPIGWFCEGPGQPIDIRGYTGQLKMKYIRFPRQVTQESDQVDITEAGYKPLVMDISSLVKNVKNWYEEAAAMAAKAKEGYSGIVQAAISARGPSSGGQPPSFEDSKIAKG